MRVIKSMIKADEIHYLTSSFIRFIPTIRGSDNVVYRLRYLYTGAIINEDVEKLFHVHLVWPVPFRFSVRNTFKDFRKGFAECGILCVVCEREVGPDGVAHLVSPCPRRVYENVQPPASF